MYIPCSVLCFVANSVQCIVFLCTFRAVYCVLMYIPCSVLRFVVHSVQCIVFRIMRTKFAHTDETVKFCTLLCANCCSYNKKNIGFLLFSLIHDASFGSE